jgi:hypothetical protein
VDAVVPGRSFRLTELRDPSHADYRRLPFPLGKRIGLLAVGVCTGKSLAVGIKDRYLPVVMLSPLIFSEACALAMRDHWTPVSRLKSYSKPYSSVSYWHDLKNT